VLLGWQFCVAPQIRVTRTYLLLSESLTTIGWSRMTLLLRSRTVKFVAPAGARHDDQRARIVKVNGGMRRVGDNDAGRIFVQCNGTRLTHATRGSRRSPLRWAAGHALFWNINTHLRRRCGQCRLFLTASRSAGFCGRKIPLPAQADAGSDKAMTANAIVKNVRIFSFCARTG
jgi:hypothetical protein